jgi:hypothetical protein
MFAIVGEMDAFVERLGGRAGERLASRPAELLAARPELAALATGFRTQSLAVEDVLVVDEALVEALGVPGLQRGWTVVVDGAPGSGATSLLFRLLAGPTRSGAWCALVGFPDLGVVAAEELGVALDRLLVVPEPKGHLAAVVAALLEGCDVVAARVAGVLGAQQAARLSARARERRAVLVVAGERVGTLTLGSRTRPVPVWPAEADLALETLTGSWVGIGEGSGRLVAHGIEVRVHRRRAVPRQQRHQLWLQGHPRALRSEDSEAIAARCRSFLPAEPWATA